MNADFMSNEGGGERKPAAGSRHDGWFMRLARQRRLFHAALAGQARPLCKTEKTRTSYDRFGDRT